MWLKRIKDQGGQYCVLKRSGIFAKCVTLPRVIGLLCTEAASVEGRFSLFLSELINFFTNRYWNSRVLAGCFVEGCKTSRGFSIYKKVVGKSAVEQIV